MPQFDQQQREKAEDEAADWLILLAEDPQDAVLQARFAAWHAAHPLYAELWARTSRAYDLAASAAQRPARPALQMMSNPAPRRRRAFQAAALAMAAAIAIALTPAALLRLQADVTTASAETRALDLADGSQLRLAPQSAVSVAITTEGRQVRLLKGRAYFEVTSDPARPFTVQTGDTRITVVGTAFDVRSDAGGTSVAVSHGRVRVEHAALLADGAALLSAGDAITLRESGATQHKLDAAEVADWRSGRLTLRDATIAEVIDELRPYFAGYIFVADDAFSRQRVSGVYDLNDPLATLQGLVAVHKGHLRQLTPWILRIQQ